VQRRSHHFGETPDAKAMEYLRDLAGAIRAKVSAGEAECVASAPREKHPPISKAELKYPPNIEVQAS